MKENPISIVKKLNATIYDDLDTSTSKEIDLCIAGVGISAYLQHAYSYLQTNLPTSVDFERCFSAAVYLDNQICSRPSDEVLDALIFLKNYLKQ